MFFLIFGVKGRITRSNADDIIEKGCPGCGNDLELSDLKRWFTLFFIPILPMQKIDTFYHCKNCDSSYKQNIKSTIIASKKDKEKVQKEAMKMFSITLVACMTHMAKIDGKISKEEEQELKRLSKDFPEFEREIESSIKKVKESDDNEYVFQMLKNATNILTAQGVMSIIGKTAQMLLADGKIDKKEEKLLQDYLLVCGIPRDLYKTIIDKIKKH